MLQVGQSKNIFAWPPMYQTQESQPGELGPGHCLTGTAATGQTCQEEMLTEEFKDVWILSYENVGKDGKQAQGLHGDAMALQQG